MAVDSEDLEETDSAEDSEEDHAVDSVVRGKCTKQLVQVAEKNAKCLSSQHKGNRCIAEIVLAREVNTLRFAFYVSLILFIFCNEVFAHSQGLISLRTRFFRECFGGD